MKARLSPRRSAINHQRLSRCFGAVVIGLVALSASAQQYALTWFKVAAGGSTLSTGGVYAVRATIGQVDAGRVSSPDGRQRVEAGFLGVAVQQAGFPTLHVAASGTNAVLSWFTAEPVFVVQFSTNLTSPTLWTDLGPATFTSGTTNALSVPLSDAARAFFRLRRP